MADDPNSNPTDPVKQYGTPSEKFNQSGVGTPSVDPSVQKTLDALGEDSNVLLQNMTKLVQLLSSSASPAAALSKEFEKWKAQLKFAVDASENVHDSLKEVLDINKKFAQVGLAGMTKKSYAEVKRYLDELTKAQKKLSTNTFLSAEGQRKLQQAMSHTARAMDTLEDSLKGVADANSEIDPDVLAQVAKNARFATSETDKLAHNLGRGGKISKGLKEVAGLMGAGALFGHFDKATGVADALNKWKKMAKEEGARGAKSRQVSFARKFGLKEDTPLDELAAYRRTSSGIAKGAGKEAISGRGGAAGILDRMMESAAGGAERGGIRGWLGKQALSTLEAGGGEAGTGLGMRALGGVASVGEGVAGAVGEAAVPLAILAAIRKVVDMVGEQNREFGKALGGAGLYTGAQAGQTAQDRLLASQQNLIPKFFSTLAVNKEGNLAIVKAIEDLGVALPELGVEQNQEQGSGILQGGAKGFGGVQSLAYRQGRQLGLDTGETARENIKYLLQFHQSQAAINKLFDQFIQDTRASGITTTKYLALIDQITGQFDRMGKSLQTVTGIMSVLGSTGTSTAEDLQDSLNFLLGGPQKTLEQTAFLLSQSTKANRQNLAAAVGNQVRAGEAQAGEALNKVGLDGISLKSIDDVRAAIQKVALDSRKDAKGNQMIDNATRKDLNGILNELLRNKQLQGNAQRFADGGEGLLDAAASLNQLGNAQTKQILSFTGVAQALQKAGLSWNDVLQGKASGALIQQLSGIYGNAPDWQKQFSQFAETAAGATVKALQTNPEAFNQADVDTMYDAAIKAGQLTAKQGITEQEKRQQVTGLANGPQAADFAVTLESNNDLMTRLVSGNASVLTAVQQSAKDQIPTAENIANVTRTTGDVISDALARGFLLLADGITRIADFMQNHWGGGGPSVAEGMQSYYHAKGATPFSTPTPAELAAIQGISATNATISQGAAQGVTGTALDVLKTRTGTVQGGGGTVTINNYDAQTSQTAPNQALPANRTSESSSSLPTPGGK